jgi:hypothetical protein
VIQIAGEWWGTAAEIAGHIGKGVTEATVRRWAGRYGLASVRLKDEDGRPRVLYLLGKAVLIDRQKRHARRGRPRIAS